jgi:hypothetical protein
MERSKLARRPPPVPLIKALPPAEISRLTPISADGGLRYPPNECVLNEGRIKWSGVSQLPHPFPTRRRKDAPHTNKGVATRRHSSTLMDEFHVACRMLEYGKY